MVLGVGPEAVSVASVPLLEVAHGRDFGPAQAYSQLIAGAKNAKRAGACLAATLFLISPHSVASAGLVSGSQADSPD